MRDEATIFGRSLAITLFIPEASNLKEKRQVLQSLTAKIRQKYNVSIIEAGYQEQWQRALLGIAFIAGRVQLLESVQQEIVEFIENDYSVEICEIGRDDF